MKVGTDAVLLGAWASLNKQDKVLDIGTGTGVIALMLAQKGAMEIDAIDINQKASELAGENFKNSPWANSLNAFYCSLKNFVLHPKTSYDLIVSNPPFFHSDQYNNDYKLMARSQESLAYKDLINYSSKLLSKSGSIALVVPYQNHDLLIKQAAELNLYLNRYCIVKGNNTSKPIRVLLQFGSDQNQCTTEYLCIEQNRRHEYSGAYRELLKDFLTIF